MSLDNSLKKFITNDKSFTTHTKIGNIEKNIFGNKYHVSKENETEFYKIYRKYVFASKCDSYLTEKQLDIGKIAIDVDFRYDSSITEKQHTNEHIDDFIELVLNICNKLFLNILNKSIHFYIMEKENVNTCEGKTKDGIHIIINIICDFTTKMILRKLILEEISNIWDDLPIINSWEDVFDEGVMKGSVNWQLYGSKKPGNESYKLKNIYNCKINDTLSIEKVDLTKIKFNFLDLCIRNNENTHQLSIHSDYSELYKRLNITDFKLKKKIKKRTNTNYNSLENISNLEEIQDITSSFLDNDEIEQKYKEVHQYTMALSKEYYGPGSYNKWIQVGWALKNMKNDIMKITWYSFSSQSAEFDFQNNDVLEYWDNFDIYNKEGLSYRSIIYWCKNSNYDEYVKIYKKTIDYYINYSFKSNTECDLANTLFNMYKSQYVCVSIKNDLWYEFLNNKWIQIDCGNTLRLRISTDMFNEYYSRLMQFQTSNQAKEYNISTTNNNINQVIENVKNGDEEFNDFKKKVNEMLSTCKLLKKTTTKNNIMKESKELFYDREFMTKLDNNPYLLGCNNCIIDFKLKIHRSGKHEDYVSKSTGLNYVPLHEYKKNKQKIIDEINDFIKQLFPNEILRKYMWEHLASTLLGTIENQTFNIYNGKGSNGKSKLVELMALVLGEYKSTVPLTLITQKRNNIGGTSSEVHNLIGTRYAVMQEPSKNDKINEGVMKELTGGDPIQCRALFKDSVTFIPQFKLVVCTNTMPEVLSNDDGTWRRLRKVDFESKFTDKPYNDPNFPERDYPHQFQVDTKIDEKFQEWAPIFLSMLVDIAYKTQGKVHDVEPVISATREYRKGQDKILEFHDDCFVSEPSPGGFTIRERDVTTRFRKWWDDNHTGESPPKTKEVKDYFIQKYGKIPPKGWTNFSHKQEFDNPEHTHALT